MEKNKTRDDLNPPGLKSRDSSRAEKAQYRSSGGLKPLGGFCEGLKKFSLQEGADLFGIADIQGIKKDFLLSEEALNKVHRAVCLGIRLAGGILGDIRGAPSRLYFHHYRTVNALLDQLAFKVASYIEKKGFLAIPIPASLILDWKNQKAHLSHKQLGVLAGLGWIGRNNLLVSSVFGSQFRLVSVLTNMPLEPDRPKDEGCGACRFCIPVCPAKAIKEEAGDFDFQGCFEKLKEFQRQRLVDQYICGVCVKACGAKK